MTRARLLLVLTSACTAVFVATLTGGAFASHPVASLDFACALKSNGLLRYVTNLNHCNASREVGVSIRPGPTLVCVLPGGFAARRVTSAAACAPPRTLLTLPSSTDVYFCALKVVGLLRRVSSPAHCTSFETRLVVANHAPTDIALSNASVAENKPAGTTVGTLSATDPDLAESFMFALVAGTGAADNGSFTIAGTTLKTAASFDYETKNSFSIRIRVRDSVGATREEVFTISVTDVIENEPPVVVDDTFTTGEDTQLDLPVSGAGSPAANDTDLDGDPLTVTAVNNASGGSVSISGGQIHFVPASNVCGAAAGGFDYTVSDGKGGTDGGHVTVDITCVDDPPTAVNDAATVPEDAAATAVDVLANDTDPDGGPKSIGSVTQPANGTVVITGGGTGLTYQPDPNYCNTQAGGSPDTFTYTLNGGSTATVSVTVTCVDDPPTAVNDAATVLEDAAATAVDVLANDTDPDGGSKSIASVTQPANGSVVITGGGTGLTYQPNVNYCNSPPGTSPDTFTYTLTPGGSTATVSVTVTCADAAPTAVNDSATVPEDAAATAVDVLANDADPDGGPKSIGSVTQPANGTVVITGGGTGLTYQPDPNYCNTQAGGSPDTFTYTLNGGSTATVSVTVTCVDDPPTAVNDSATVLEDAAATAVDVLANDADPDGGPKTIASASDPANGTVVITGGGTGLTYQPDPNYCNTQAGGSPDTFTYTLNGGSTATVSVTVTCVNDAPVADDEAFGGNDSAHGNTAMVVNDPDDGAPNPAYPKTTISGDILAGDTDVDGPGPLTVTPGTFATNDGGSVTIEGDGDFTFHPAASTSCTDTSDFFDYTVRDSGSPERTDSGRVTIAIAGCVWYVSNNAAGNSGTSAAPFDTLAQAETASGANHTVFVFDGDNTSTGLGGGGYAMNAGERLIGEHEGLQVDPDGGGPLTVDTLHPPNPGAHPTLTATSADVIDLDDGNEVRGLNVDPQSAGGIAGGAGDTGGGTIDDVNVVDTVGAAGTQAGLELSGTTGTFNVTNLAVNSNAAGVLLTNADTVDFGSTTITSNGLGLSAAGTNMSTSTFDSITVTNSANGGVSMINTTGTTTFGGLSLTTTSGTTPAFSLSNAGTVTVSAAGTANVSATGGPAVDVTGTAGATLAFDSVSSTNSANDGINLTGLGTGTFSATGGSIGGATGIAFDLDGGSGAVSYPGALNNGAGQTAEITNRSGGTVTLSGAIADTNDAGGGIALTSNTGATIDLTGSMALDTGASPAFAATGGGTVTVTGATNTIASTTGTPLNVANTTIGAGGLTFRSISSNGAANGIVLNDTGSSGSLSVTGLGSTAQGGDNSGGTIQSTTGHGIALTNTTSPSFRNVRLLNTGNSGVNGTQVSGFTFIDGAITGAGDAADESSITFDDSLTTTANLTGVVTITNNVISQTEAEGIDILNFAGTINDANISGNALSDTGDVATPGSAVSLIASGTPTTAASITRATISNNTITDFRAGFGVQVRGGNVNAGGPAGRAGTAGSATDVIAITGNLMNGGSGGVGNQPDRFVTAGATGIGQGNFNVSSNGTAANRIRNIDCIAIELQADGPVNVTTTVQNNFINANSGIGCAGIAVGTDDPSDMGAGTHSTLISGNNVMGTDGPGIFTIVRDSGSTMIARVLNNTVAAPIATNAARAGIRVDSGSASGDTTLCLEISGNVTAGSTNTGTGTTSPGINLRKQGTDPAVNTFGIEGMAATSTPGVENYVNALNTSTSGTFGVGGTALLSATSGFTNCNAP